MNRIKKEYKRVNWVKGMKVRFDMFKQTEDYYTSLMCDNTAVLLNKNKFGLLPSFDGKADSTEFEISKNITGTVEVKLLRCNAVTQAGCRISYNPPVGQSISYSHRLDTAGEHNKSETIHWDIILVADPFSRIPSGLPNEKEIPVRHPDADSFYALSLIERSKLKPRQLGMYHMVIGRIRQNGERFEVDTDFIPPCTTMFSHRALINYYEQFGKLLNDIESCSQTIIAKIRNRANNAPVALHIEGLCKDMMRYIAGILPHYRNSAMDESPVSIVNCFSALARTCYTAMNFISKSEKEELLRYFYEWSDVTPGSFDELLAITANVKYDHNDIRTVMIQIESFLRVMAELWLKLSTLEYIGKQKESIIISVKS